MMEGKPLIVEKTLNASIERVWKAITDNREMKNWYFNLPVFKPEVGFEFEFDAGSDEKKYLHQCRITEVIPGEKLSYTWKYRDYPGESEVSFELVPEGEKTLIRLTHTGLETFPKDSPDFARESFTEGWNDILGRSLKNFVEAA